MGVYATNDWFLHPEHQGNCIAASALIWFGWNTVSVFSPLWDKFYHLLSVQSEDLDAFGVKIPDDDYTAREIIARIVFCYFVGQQLVDTHADVADMALGEAVVV